MAAFRPRWWHLDRATTIAIIALVFSGAQLLLTAPLLSVWFAPDLILLYSERYPANSPLDAPEKRTQSVGIYNAGRATAHEVEVELGQSIVVGMASEQEGHPWIVEVMTLPDF